MSVFDENNDAPTAIDQFVGEGKKFSSVDELVRSYSHSQQFIEQLKTENQGLREDLGQRAGAEELYKKIVETKPEPSTKVAEASEVKNPPAGEPTLEVDLARKIDEAIQAKEAQRAAANNAEEVARRLVEAYGSEEKANEVVRAKAAELGVSVSWLQDIAVQSPKAFFATTGLEQRQSADPTPTRGNVNPAALKPTDTGSATYGTKAYFDAMRRNDPAQYWNPSTQNAIFKAAKEGLYKVD